MTTVRVNARNDRYQLLTSLRDNRHKRTKLNAIFAEGVAIINAIREAQVRVRQVVTARVDELSDWAREMIQDLDPDEHLILSDELYKELSNRSDPTELIAVAERPRMSLGEWTVGPSDLYVLLDRPASPGNLGSCIRSCSAFGVRAVLLLGHAADPWDPQSLRASIGSVFSQSIVQIASLREFEDWVAHAKTGGHALRVIGTDSQAATSVAEAEFARPAVIALGNEATGLSENLRASVDSMIRIATPGRLQSLNLASALSILLYAFTSQPGAGE